MKNYKFLFFQILKKFNSRVGTVDKIRFNALNINENQGEQKPYIYSCKIHRLLSNNAQRSAKELSAKS